MAVRALSVLVLLAAVGCSGAQRGDGTVVIPPAAERGAPDAAAPADAAPAEAKPKWRRGAVACRSDAIRPSILAGVTTAVPLDAIELRQGRRPEDPGELLDARGDVCAKLDAGGCDAARRRFAPGEGFRPACEPSSCFHYLLLRHGDRIATASRLSDVVRVLAPIDTEHDALLLAWASGYYVACGGDGLEGEIERTDGGFRYTVEAMTALCPPVTSRIVVDITRDGAVNELSRRAVRHGTGCILI